ncbi:MAG: hypothetical protein E7F52_25945, partial [Klebsiella pneumoniae]|nr:hypothetical protein [Klebsiella pneumoniae]
FTGAGSSSAWLHNGKRLSNSRRFNISIPCKISRKGQNDCRTYHSHRQDQQNDGLPFAGVGDVILDAVTLR